MYHAANSLVQQITGGSHGIRSTGQAGMRVAEPAKEMMKAAAGKWQVNESELTANSVVTHKASGRSATYGELASAAARFEPSLNRR